MGKLTNEPDELVLRKETAEGFVDRGGTFRTSGASTFVAERWVSDYFNVRPNPKRDAGDDAGGSEG